MSRVIKFRGWDALRKEMFQIHPKMLGTHSNGHFFCVVYDYESNEAHIPIQQFTGLHDRNGVEVFEGDILEHFDEKFSRNRKPLRFVMEWDADRAAWSTYHPKDSFFVAGNKWANPELLEGEKV